MCWWTGPSLGCAEGCKSLHCKLTSLPAWLQGEIECELPNASLYTFTGNLCLHKEQVPGQKPATLPLSQASVLLRGCNLRNTDHILGVVIFAGHETKVGSLALLRSELSQLCTLAAPFCPWSGLPFRPQQCHAQRA